MQIKKLKKESLNTEDCCTEEVGILMQRLVRVFQLFEREQIKTFGVTTTQCYCLVELHKAQSLTMNEISHKMNLDTSTMTRIIDKLVRDQLVVRDRQEEDRRIVVVKLTDRGKNLAVQLNESIQAYYREIAHHLPEGQVMSVLDSVSLLLEAFDQAKPNCC